MLLVACRADGYPAHDMQVRWRGNTTRQAVLGIDQVAIPQFTVLDIRTGAAAALTNASFGNVAPSSQHTDTHTLCPQKSEPPKHFATAAANLHRFK